MSTTNIIPNDMSCLDEKLALSFVSESNEAVFYPQDSNDFLEYLSDADESLTEQLFSGNLEDLAPVLSEAVLVYLDDAIQNAGDDCCCKDYYSQLKNFLESTEITGVEIASSIKSEESSEDEESEEEFDDEDVQEAYKEFMYDLKASKTGNSILENIDNLVSNLDYIPEVLFKKIVRGGKVRKKAICPPGTRYDSGARTCKRMAASEIRKRFKAAIKARKTRKKHARNAMFVRALMKKRKKSLKFRRVKGLH
jgi:hypothetical protein